METFEITYHIYEGRGKNRKVTEETRVYRRMTLEECKKLSYGNRVQFLSKQGSIKELKVNGEVRTWKTRKDIRIPLKYGLYEYSYCSCEVDDDDGTESWNGEILVVEVSNE